MTSVNSGSQARDEYLRYADFFDTTRHHPQPPSPAAPGGRIPRPRRPQGRPPGRFTANGTLDREDWGLSWNLPLDGGGLLVSREIRIEIDLEAVLQP